MLDVGRPLGSEPRTVDGRIRQVIIAVIGGSIGLRADPGRVSRVGWEALVVALSRDGSLWSFGSEKGIPPGHVELNESGQDQAGHESEHEDDFQSQQGPEPPLVVGIFFQLFRHGRCCLKTWMVVSHESVTGQGFGMCLYRPTGRSGVSGCSLDHLRQNKHIRRFLAGQASGRQTALGFNQTDQCGRWHRFSKSQSGAIFS